MAAETKSIRYRDYLTRPVQDLRAEPSWTASFRQAAFEKFKKIGFPSRQNEGWKYLHLETLLSGEYSTGASQSKRLLKDGLSRQFQEAGLGRNQFIFWNGRFSFEDSAFDEKTLQVTAGDPQSGSWIESCLASGLEEEKNAFSLINAMEFEDGFFLKIPKNTRVEEPVHLSFFSTAISGKPPAFYPRLVILVEEGAEVRFVISHENEQSAAYLMNMTAEFHLAANAKAECLTLQRESQGIELIANRVSLKADSHFEAVTLVSGGSIIRDETEVRLLGENASCSIHGLSLLDENSQAFHHVTVHHTVPNGSSRQVYKNILSGQSRAEFNSLVHVWRDAQKSDSEQMDKNLLLSDRARVYSRPQLKIDADDVRATHGAATGQLDEKEIFYLQSRGLDKAFARFVLLEAFASQILEKVRPEGLRDFLRNEIHCKISKMIQESKYQGKE